MKSKLKFKLPALLYMGLILSISSLNQQMVSKYSFGLEDFMLHAVEYNVLGVLLIWAIYSDKAEIELKQSYRLAMGAGTLFAMADEFLQSFIPSRHASLEDVVADVFGLILSIISFSLLMKIPGLQRLRQNA